MREAADQKADEEVSEVEENGFVLVSISPTEIDRFIEMRVP